MNLTFVRPEDGAALLAIYGEYIDTAITFEYTLPTQEEIDRRIETISADYPYLVAREGERPVGYAYAHRQMERAAYQWNAELSVYLDRATVSRGLGKRLYGALMEILRLQQIRTVCGIVTLPNEKSEGLHKSLGFTQTALHRCAGYKNGQWHDVAWFERSIAPFGEVPEPFTPIGMIPPTELEAILRRYSD